MQRADRPRSASPLWTLPLAAGLLPAVAALTALWLSIELGLVPACNPLLDGCVSISRAARYELPNHIFRALILPAAVLQVLTWLLCTAWLREMEADSRRAVRVLPWLGVAAGISLVLYGTFLGTEGEAYRWMRRHGVILYFGFTYLCMLIASGTILRLTRARALAVPARPDQFLLGLCAVTLLLGLAQLFVTSVLEAEDLKNRLENLLEWYAALAFTLFFLALTWLWRHTRFRARLGSR